MKKRNEESVGAWRGAGKAILEGYTQTTFDAMMSWQTLQCRGDGRPLIGSQGDYMDSATWTFQVPQQGGTSACSY